MITKFKLFERKGNYQLFHKTSSLKEIIDSGYIKPGDDMEWWNFHVRKNVFSNWKEDDIRFRTISVTRNFNYSLGDTIELDVEKISDRFRIVPFSENPDFYLDFMNYLDKSKEGLGEDWRETSKKYGKLELSPPPKNYEKPKNDGAEIERMVRSKSKGAGKLFWKVKTDKYEMDFGIAEELIVVGKHGKLDVSKYVKRILLEYEKPKLEAKIKEKYPHIEVLVLSDREPYYMKKKREHILKNVEKQYQEA